MPPCPNGRAEDNWRPLIGIADLAEGIWPERARKAFITFNSESEEGDEETMRIQVLRDIQTIFDQAEEKEMWSESLIEKLVEMEDRPWSEYKGGFKPITAHSLSRLLKPFEIKSVQIWESGSNRRGYRMEQFADAFARYLY
jgi:putative DNA primase/helicase